MASIPPLRFGFMPGACRRCVRSAVRYFPFLLSAWEPRSDAKALPNKLAPSLPIFSRTGDHYRTSSAAFWWRAEPEPGWAQPMAFHWAALFFALEVMRGKLALRFVLPALFTSLIATAVSWLALPDAPTYIIPAFPNSASVLVWALLVAPVAGVASVAFVRLIRWADRNKPQGWQRIIAPVIVLGLLGIVSIWFPQILGNGKDISQLLFSNQVAPALVFALFFLKPAATIFCMRSGAPGGLFTPSLTAGALLGAVLGHAWSWVWPGVPPGLFAVLGAGAVLAATTQGPVSAVVLMMELTGRDRSFILPLLLIVGISTLVARSIEPRSIYDAKLTDEEVEHRLKLREQATQDF